MLASGGIKCVSPCAGQKGKVFSVGQRIQKPGEGRIMVTLREEVEEVRWGRRGREGGWGGQFTPTGHIVLVGRKSTSFTEDNNHLFT